MIKYASTDKEKAEIAEAILNSKGLVSVEVKRVRTRTQAQNASMHLWLTQVAKALNDGGYDMQTVLAETIGLSWTMEAAKDNLWRPVQRAMLKKHSTTELYKLEVTDVYEHLSRFLAEKFGISIPWPSVETMRNEP